MKHIKDCIQLFFNRCGYEVRKLNEKIIDDTNLYYKYYPKWSVNDKKFYNIGAGTFRHPFWKNIDLASEWYAESQLGSDMINHDLFSTDPIPVEDNSAEIVYTSHTVEHINDDAAQRMFNEAYRMLKPGGLFRLTTPDIDLYYKAFRKNDTSFYWWIDLYSRKEVCEKIHIYPFNQFSLSQIFLFSFSSHTSKIVTDTTIEKFSDEEILSIFENNSYENALNIFTSRCTIDMQRKFFGYHMNWWNWDKTSRMLRSTGFTDIYKSGYGQSVSPVMRNTQLFDKQDPKDSLYVEAIK